MSWLEDSDTKAKTSMMLKENLTKVWQGYSFMMEILSNFSVLKKYHLIIVKKFRTIKSEREMKLLKFLKSNQNKTVRKIIKMNQIWSVNEERFETVFQNCRIYLITIRVYILPYCCRGKQRFLSDFGPKLSN